MTDETQPAPGPSRSARIAAALPPGADDALLLVLGGLFITLAVAAVDWRAGLFVAGVLLLADVIVDRLLKRTRP